MPKYCDPDVQYIHKIAQSFLQNILHNNIPPEPEGKRFCGGVGGLVVGAGPAEFWLTLPTLPYWDLPGPY